MLSEKTTDNSIGWELGAITGNLVGKRIGILVNVDASTEKERL